jgi:AraC-like DNA-binding protein
MQMEIRAAAIRGIDRLIDDLGGDGAALLAGFGVSPADLESDHGLLPTVTAGRILRRATKALNCPDLGLRLAAYQDMSMLGPLALAVGNCDTVGEGGGYELLGVYLPHPPLTDASVYTEFFGAPVHFDTGRALLRVPTKLFAHPMSTPVNPELRRMVVEYLEAHYTDPREGVAAAVRSAVSRALGTVPVRIDLVAAWLHLHPRTLQRRLAREGTTFQAILDDVRKNAAYRLLTGSDMPLSQVAALVELAGQAALTRAARRWFGRTPSQVRREARHAPSGVSCRVK